MTSLNLSDEQLEFERGGDFDQAAFRMVLRDSVTALNRAGIAYVLMGGLASAHHGRPRCTHDIDLFVKPQEAKAALGALDAAGFQTQETYPDWLYKGLRDGVLVDIIFRSMGDIYLDDEMLQRAHDETFDGLDVKVISPEDLLVIKAVVHDEHMPRHWHDALGIIATFKLDWQYVSRRANKGARRVLSLLIYAQSNDLMVPNSAIESLFEAIYEPTA